MDGAQGLRELGVEHARRYEQTNRVNQAHDICTLDVRFAAQAASLQVETERTLVNTFLDFHGLRHDHPGCRVWVTPPDLSGERGSDFAVQVALDVSWSEADQASQPTWAEFEDKTSDAIAWVLQQLIDYPQIVGIDEKKEKPQKQTLDQKGSKRRQ